MTIADNLKRLRKKAKLSQAALAQKAGVSQQLISHLENLENVSTTKLPALAKVLGCKVEDIDPDYRSQGLFDDDEITTAYLIPSDFLYLTRKFEGFDFLDHVEGKQLRYIKIGGMFHGDWFAASPEDDSLDRVAPQYSIVLVDRSKREFIQDHIYLCLVGSKGTPVMRRYKEGEPGRLQPYSNNPDHETLFVDDYTVVLGRIGRVLIDL